MNWFINLYIVETKFIYNQIEENKFYMLHLFKTTINTLVIFTLTWC